MHVRTRLQCDCHIAHLARCTRVTRGSISPGPQETSDAIQESTSPGPQATSAVRGQAWILDSTSPGPQATSDVTRASTNPGPQATSAVQAQAWILGSTSPGQPETLDVTPASTSLAQPGTVEVYAARKSHRFATAVDHDAAPLIQRKSLRGVFS